MKRFFLFIIALFLFAFHSEVFSQTKYKYEYTLTLESGTRIHFAANNPNMCKYVVEGVKCSRSSNKSKGIINDHTNNLSKMTITKIKDNYFIKLGEKELLKIDSKGSKIINELSNQIEIAKKKITTTSEMKK